MDLFTSGELRPTSRYIYFKLNNYFFKLDASLEMKDTAGSPTSEKMKITITLVSGPSLDNIKEFLDAVDASVGRLKSVGAGGGRTVTVLGNVLQLTKNIFDNLSQVSTKLTIDSR